MHVLWLQLTWKSFLSPRCIVVLPFSADEKEEATCLKLHTLLLEILGKVEKPGSVFCFGSHARRLPKHGRL